MKKISSYESLQIQSVLKGQPPEIQPGLALHLMLQGEQADRVYDIVAGPAFWQNDLNVEKLGIVFDSSSALYEVSRWIGRAEVIVADLTPWSPDLMYVLGLCHGLGAMPAAAGRAGDGIALQSGICAIAGVCAQQRRSF